MTTIPPKTYDFSNRALYNDAYIELFENNSRFIHLFGSAGSGKSNFAFQREIVESYDWRRRNRKTLVIRQVFNTLKDSCYADLKAVIYDWGLEDDFEMLKSPLFMRNKLTNVEFIFRGLEEVERLKSIKGVDRAIIEEATEMISPKPLRQISLRIRGFSNPGGQITLMYNPIDEFHWLNTEVHQAGLPNHFIKKTTYKDNRFLDAEYIAELEGLASQDSNYHKVYVLGEWGTVVEGLIYPEHFTEPFPQKEIDGKLVDDIDYYGLDFGFSDPHALVALKIVDAKPKKKLYCKEILYESGLEATELIKRFNELGVSKKIKMTADSARPEMIKSLKDIGKFNIVGCEKGAGSVLTGINRIRDYQIIIAPGSKNLFKEIRNYQKREINGQWLEEPALHQVDHLLDAIRYGEQAAGKKPITTRPFGLFN
jgi:phage terminase large subunit